MENTTHKIPIRLFILVGAVDTQRIFLDGHHVGIFSTNEKNFVSRMFRRTNSFFIFDYTWAMGYNF